MTSKTPLLISKSPKQKKNTEKPGLKRHFHKRDRKPKKKQNTHTNKENSKNTGETKRQTTRNSTETD
jgi:hypothetical protein